MTVTNKGENEKKTYHKPNLIDYGDLRELTEASGNTATPDGYLNQRTA